MSIKKNLLALKQGQLVNFWGPIGNFVLPDEPKPLIFISLGIGITPFRSLLLSAKSYSSPITLLAFFRTKDDEVFYNELNKLETNKNISINYLTTSIHGHLSEGLIRRHAPKIDKLLYYISGPVSGVQSVSEMLEEMGVKKEQIKKEQFTGY